MNRRRLFGSAAVGAIAAAVAAAPIAWAQYTSDPFFDSTVQLSQTIGLELALQRLRIVEAIDPPFEAEFAEVVENLTGPDFQRFGGTLAAMDAELAEQLFEVLEAVAEAVEEGADDEVAYLLPTAREMLNQAYDLVVPPEVRDTPAFKGAVMAQLLLGEGGVAEGLEEAFEEEWEYANGWGATQRIKVLWGDISGLATAEQVADIEEMIDALDAIYPSPEPPESFAGIDPEEAETPAQRIVGFLEVVVDAQLYSGRDPARLIGHLAEATAAGCARYEAGEDELGREIMYAVFDHYAGETTGLGALINLFAPEVHEGAMEGFEHLVVVEDDDDEGGDDDAPAGGDDAAGDDDDDEGMEAAEACEVVLEAIEEGRAVLGG
jgi:hypothetical protein